MAQTATEAFIKREEKRRCLIVSTSEQLSPLKELLSKKGYSSQFESHGSNFYIILEDSDADLRALLAPICTAVLAG